MDDGVEKLHFNLFHFVAIDVATILIYFGHYFYSILAAPSCSRDLVRGDVQPHKSETRQLTSQAFVTYHGALSAT